VQEELEAITRRMGSLRDSLFEEGAATLAKASQSRTPSVSESKTSSPARGRKPGRPAKRAQRGALKEQIVGALNTAGAAGVLVTELAKALGMKPVNIHSWFHSSTKRYPQIRKLKGGHYRLEGKLEGAAAPAGRAKATAPKGNSAKPTGTNGNSTPASNGRTPVAARKGAQSNGRRGALSEKVLGELRKAGAKGVSVRDIANRIGANSRNIYIWFATTGKKNAAVKKVGPAQYRLVS
jgi:hypothetical protein